MFTRVVRAVRPVLVVALLSAPGCAGLGSMGEILVPGAGGQVAGEVRRIDARRQTIELSSWSGPRRVFYDGRTQVVYRSRRYPVRALERGDRVRVQVERDRYGDLYARRVHVERSVRDRAGDRERDHHRRFSTYEGRVARIDRGDGWMVLRRSYGGALTVTLPHRPDKDLRRAFRRLREGDYVRVLGEPLHRGRVEAHRIY